MKNKDSDALREVWEWKDLAYQEVEQLPIEEAVKKRLEDVLQVVQQLGLTVSDKVDEIDIAHAVNQ